ncbi:BgTH12-05877 [Blumeria graminis f. sp. triticale]|nr:BgTH12-05877 [Blumeria graminis f. sp. triticale]
MMTLHSMISSAPNCAPILAIGIYFLLTLQIVTVSTSKSTPPPNIKLDDLGRTALVGNFDGISVYKDEEYRPREIPKNGSQSLYSRLPDGGFMNVASSDANILAMCTSRLKNSEKTGIVIGGNFTDLAGLESPGIASYDPSTSTIIPLPGLSGQVSALLCDQEAETVYIGGNFKVENSTNAIAWSSKNGWKSLPFGGFNGPVTTISKASNGNIIFGGSFTGLGNATEPEMPDQQLVNIKDAKIKSSSPESLTPSNDPSRILCKSNGTGNIENPWLLADNTPGFWRADFGFSFQPTKLRLWNIRQSGRGTKTFRFTAFPINGIMNLSYIDPMTNQNNYCSSECSLTWNASVLYQDFHFVNIIGMNAIQIDISAWYGIGGGLSGIELFQNDIYSYAINEFNEPGCTNSNILSTATTTGQWTISSSLQSSSAYLTSLTSNTDSSVTFTPSIRQSGNYSVNMYTPGCIQDSTCATRGRVNITGLMNQDISNGVGFSTEIFQTNNHDKYDQIYFGYVEASSSKFRPSVTIALSSNQAPRDITLVAQRIGFTLISPSGGLNGLFEYDPKEIRTDASNHKDSAFEIAGKYISSGAEIKTLQSAGNTTYVGGNFTNKDFSNIFKVTGPKVEAISGNGLNGNVQTMMINENNLYVGGSFTSTIDGSLLGLFNVAAYNIKNDRWSPLGAGVNGPLLSIVPILMNITNEKPETMIALTGHFDKVLEFDKNPSFYAEGFAIWVPSRNNWLQNIFGNSMKIEGEITTALNLPDGASLYAGSILSSQLSAIDIAQINAAGNALRPFPIRIQPSVFQSPKIIPGQVSSQSKTGIVTGLFFVRGSHNITVLGGHFTAKGYDGLDVNNLAFIDGANDDIVTGVGPSLSNDSTILAMSILEDNLFAGGSLAGNVNGANIRGLISYNIPNASFNTQPPELDGNVNTIINSKAKTDIFVGGNFSFAGSLSCPAVCHFSSKFSQWNRPGIGLDGIANSMIWANSSTSLIVGGNLKINGQSASLVTFNTKSLNWTIFAHSEMIPGPVDSITKADSDSSQIWVSGLALNGTAFLMKFDGNSWASVGNMLGPNTRIKGLQVLKLISNHAPSKLVPADSALLVTGSINIEGFGRASAALFNGIEFHPYIITSSAGQAEGSLSQFFAEKANFFHNSNAKLAKGFVILIALGIALALIMVVVVGGICVERIRKKREGYTPAPTSGIDRGNSMTTRVPPDKLFGSLGQGGRKAVEKQAALL